MSNKRLKIAELDFDAIKANLKDFLRGQSTFSDFDFEGSNMSVLLDVLAYNTHYNAMYMNFALNESFIDSASKRDSVVSLARGLGYTPRSAICAKTNISFSVIPGSIGTAPAILTLPAKLPFYGEKDGYRFIFYTDDDISASLSAGQYTFNRIPVKEGTPLRVEFGYNTQNSYIIPNTNVDTTTIKVTVFSAIHSTDFIVYNLATNYAQLHNESQVYFLSEMEGGLYRLRFGDGIIGGALVPGNMIVVEYMTCNGSAPNNIVKLNYGGDTILNGTITQPVLEYAVTGGGDPETLEEIRFNAPNMYAAQNRVVTIQDYKVFLKNKMAGIGEAIVWGGENNDPPVYGSVFVSAITPDGYPLTTAHQLDVSNTLESFKMSTIQVRYVDAEFLEVALEANVYYDATLTNLSPSDLKTAIQTAYGAYNNSQLIRFDAAIRNSALIHTAEKASPAITNVVPKLKVSYKLNTLFNTKATYAINMKNPMMKRAGSFSSNTFYCTEAIPVNGTYPMCQIDDSTEGKLTLFSIINGVRTNIREVGTIDYTTGSFVINTLTITSVGDGNNDILLTFTPASPDVVGFANKIVRLDMNKLTINVISDTSINGQTKNSYQFIQV